MTSAATSVKPIFTAMRKITLLLTLGLFLSATAANACDGEKATKTGKSKKATAAACKEMKNCKGMTTAEMKKSGCCAHGAKATETSATSATSKPACEAKASAGHKCCKAKTETAEKS
jgi:hypothetical protein